MAFNIKCLFRFSLQRLSETYFILDRTERDMIKTPIGLHGNKRYICRNFKGIDCPDIFSKNIYISNIIKIRPVRSELFHADRRTDRQDAAKVVFRKFTKVPISGIIPL